MKKRLVIIIPVIIVSIFVIIFIIRTNHHEVEADKEKLVENVINNIYYNDKVTKKELEKNTNAIIMSGDIFYGPDSIVRIKPSVEVIKKYHLEEYEKIQNGYYKPVEEKCKNGTEYTMKEANGKVEMKVIPWNYSQYSTDLNIISTKLMEREGYSMEDVDLSSIEFTVNEYKARTIALKILNDHLDDYDNKTKEEVKVEIEFNGNTAKKNNYFTLYTVLSGFTLSNSAMSNLNYAEDNNERLEGYITEAINNHLIDS